MEFVTLPEFYMPFTVEQNPKLPALSAHARTWARQTGMLGADRQWNKAQLNAADYPLFAALTHPHAAVDELFLVNDWHMWMWFANDTLRHTADKERAAAELFVRQTLDFATATASTDPSPSGPVQRALADVWSRTARQAPLWCTQRLHAQLLRFIASWQWKLRNLCQNRIPDPVDYVELRRRTSGAEISATLAMYAAQPTMPPELADAGPVRTLIDTFSDIGPLRNDIISYDKEVLGEGERNNGVLVVREFLGCPLDDAVDVINELVTARLHEFENTACERPPGLAAGTGAENLLALRTCKDALRAWLAGDLRWATVTGRYRLARLPGTPRTSPIPTGNQHGNSELPGNSELHWRCAR